MTLIISLSRGVLSDLPQVGNPLKPNAEARAAQQAQREEFEEELRYSHRQSKHRAFGQYFYNLDSLSHPRKTNLASTSDVLSMAFKSKCGKQCSQATYGFLDHLIRARRQRIAARDAADRLTLNLMFAAAIAVAVVAAGAHILKRRAAANAEPERMRKIAAKLRATQAAVEAEKQRCLAELADAEEDADADDDNDANASDSGKDAAANQPGQDEPVQAHADDAEDSDEGESSSHRRHKHSGGSGGGEGGGGASFKCDVCKKRYKSEGQLESHLASKAHLKAAKEAAGAAKKPKAT